MSIPARTSSLAVAVSVGVKLTPLAILLEAETVALNVFDPTNVCVPVETKPGLVSLAAERVKVVPLIVPPVEYDVALV
jgi:hypothetical protein